MCAACLMARNRVSHEFLPGRGQNVATREAVFQLLRNRRQMVSAMKAA